MYDAKEREELMDSIHNLEGKSVCDRIYFTQVQSDCMMNLKSSYIPKERYIKVD